MFDEENFKSKQFEATGGTSGIDIQQELADLNKNVDSEEEAVEEYDALEDEYEDEFVEEQLKEYQQEQQYELPADSSATQNSEEVDAQLEYKRI